MVRQLPTAFAVIREQGSNGPMFQFLTSEEVGEYDGHSLYLIQDATWGSEMRTTEFLASRHNEWDPSIRPMYCDNYADSVRIWNYWYLPYSFSRNNTELPILEFQYKSWLPRAVFQLPIDRSRTTILQELHTINRERMAEIHRQNNGNITPIRPPLREGQPPPVIRRRRRLSHTNIVRQLDYRDLAPAALSIPEISFEDFLADETMPENGSTMHIGEEDETDDEEENIELPEAFRIHSESSISAPPAARPLLLPQHVGELLLISARSSRDICPITAQLYSECSQLSVTSCFHVFSTESLATWRRDGRNNCPTCRTEIVNVITE